MATFSLDVTKEHCPMTYVKTKLELEKLSVGDHLEVLVGNGEALETIPLSAKEQGFEVTDITHVEGLVYRISIDKNK